MSAIERKYHKNRVINILLKKNRNHNIISNTILISIVLIGFMLHCWLAEFFFFSYMVKKIVVFILFI